MACSNGEGTTTTIKEKHRSLVNKPATEARSGINPFTKEPMEFATKPASKTVKASPLKAAKDAV
jgi:DNA-binding protein HU-beta